MAALDTAGSAPAPADWARRKHQPIAGEKQLAQGWGSGQWFEFDNGQVGGQTENGYPKTGDLDVKHSSHYQLLVEHAQERAVAGMLGDPTYDLDGSECYYPELLPFPSGGLNLGSGSLRIALPPVDEPAAGWPPGLTHTAPPAVAGPFAHPDALAPRCAMRFHSQMQSSGLGTYHSARSSSGIADLAPAKNRPLEARERIPVALGSSSCIGQR